MCITPCGAFNDHLPAFRGVNRPCRSLKELGTLEGPFGQIFFTFESFGTTALSHDASTALLSQFRIGVHNNSISQAGFATLEYNCTDPFRPKHLCGDHLLSMVWMEYANIYDPIDRSNGINGVASEQNGNDQREPYLA